MVASRKVGGMEGATLHLEYELAKCLHSLCMGHALQLGLLLVQKTCSHTQQELV